MRYRVKTITYHDGQQNFVPQKLTLTGYKNIGNGLGGDRIFDSKEKAVEFIRKLKARKFSYEYL